MRAALARHDALLREAIALHGGTVFKTVGDAFCVVFDQPANAFAAAYAGQRALAAEAWPAEIAQLQVRMAIHLGAVEHRDGDYFGAAVNRCHHRLELQPPVSGRTRPLSSYSTWHMSRSARVTSTVPRRQSIAR